VVCALSSVTGERLEGAVDGFAAGRIVGDIGRLEDRVRVAALSWTVTLEIAGWVVVVAAHPAL